MLVCGCNLNLGYIAWGLKKNSLICIYLQERGNISSFGSAELAPASLPLEIWLE